MDAMQIPTGEFLLSTPDETFNLGGRIGTALIGGEVILLKGTLGSGKTLLTKGIVNELGFDVDEVTSPSFTLVNLYHAERFDVYHIDLWRIEDSRNAAFAVGLEEILENKKAIIIIEWAERLGEIKFDRNAITIEISGDGDGTRKISIARNQENGE